MRVAQFTFFTLIFPLFISVNAQTDHQSDPVLFQVGEEKITKNDFLYVFQKNNANKTDYTLSDLEDYLKLYINFRLKVKEANSLRIDTIPKVQFELENYHNTLVNNFLERTIMNPLIKEAYQRIGEDRRVSHILFELEPGATPEDTAIAYQKAMQARQRINRGESFEKVALEVSDDPYVRENRGDIGFITGLQLPFYHFENAVYNTPIGNISRPVRTRFGYHILKVTEFRPAAGKMTAAHILVELSPDADEKAEIEARKRIEKILERLETHSFSEVASEYSQDQGSAAQGGLLPEFGAGRMVPRFEEAAFALQNDGDISQPVRTQFGYHIIQRINKKGIAPLEEMREEIKLHILRDERYQIARQNKIDSYKREHSLLEFPARLDEVVALIDSSIYSLEWSLSDLEKHDRTLFMLEGESVKTSDFLEFIQKNQRKYRRGSFQEIVNFHYNDFLNSKVLEFGLSHEFPEFTRIRDEYRHGIMMFELMETRIWNRALLDTTGLQKFYQANKDKYMWDDRIEADILFISEPSQVNRIKRRARRNSNERLLSRFNKDEENPVLEITSGKFEKGNDPVVDKAWGSSELSTARVAEIKLEDGRIALINVRNFIEPQPKSLRESRGFHIADYQEFLERQWMKELSEQYPVTVYEDVLESLAK